MSQKRSKRLLPILSKSYIQNEANNLPHFVLPMKNLTKRQKIQIIQEIIKKPEEPETDKPIIIEMEKKDERDNSDYSQRICRNAKS